jgi:DNA end-binding protein Ku
MAPRSIWNGTVMFAQVAIPVKLYTAVEQKERIRFREVRLSDGSRVRHRRIGSESGEEIPSEEIGRAYEAVPGEQIVLTDDDLVVASQTREKTIEIESFVDRSEIDPIYFERPYILGPQPGAEHAYRVLLDALGRRGKVGIGRFVLRSRERMVALGAEGGALRLFTMRFADELVQRTELDLPKLPDATSAKELALARQLIDTLAVEWEPDRHEDRYRGAVMDLIKQKATGAEITAAPEPEPEPAPDLMTALQQSIDERQSGRKPASTRRKRGDAPATTSQRKPGTRTSAKSSSRSKAKKS